MTSNAELLIDLGININKIKSSGKTVCPECSHTRKKKTDPCLSVNITEGLYRCHNCGWAGSVGMKKAFEKKEYTRPVFNNRTNLPENIVKFFQKRCISQDTLRDFKITHSRRYFPQISTESESIDFNYFVNGELTNVKYRGPKKSFSLNKGSELVFYNLDAIKESEEVYIVEGEIDAMSLHQVGIKNVISVPNGATLSENSNLEYIDNSIDFLSLKTKFIIATDNDEPGRALRKELTRRLGSYRCHKVDLGERKDANDVLMFDGPEKLREIFLSSKEMPIDGVITAVDVWEDLEFFFENGLSRGVTTQTMPELDKLISFVGGQTMAITGVPNHGKSLLANMIMISLAVNHGWKFGVFSPEHKPLQLYLAKLCEIVLGKRLKKGVGFSRNERDLAKKFLNDHFFFIEPEDGYSLDNILSTAESLVFKKGIRGLIIDPWNKIDHKMKTSETETMYISRALDEIISFGQKNDVFNILIAHPTKIRKKPNGLYEIPTLYDIAGSANFFNKVDWGVCFYRNYQSGNNEIYVQKSKWEHLGKIGNFEAKFNVNNGRLCCVDMPWDNDNWIRPKEVQSDLFFSSNEDDMFKNEVESEPAPF